MSLDDILFEFPELNNFDIDDLENMDEFELQDLIDEFETDTTLPANLRRDFDRIEFKESNKQEIKEKYGLSEREWLRAENLSIKSQLASEEAKRESMNSGIKSLNEGTLSMSTGEVIFVTREDDRVCTICEGFEGDIFGVDPATKIIDGPTIPDDTHLNCRCRYLIFNAVFNF